MMQTVQQKAGGLKASALVAMSVSVFIMLVGLVEILPAKFFPPGILFFCAGLMLLLVSFLIEMKKLDHVGSQIILGFVLLFNGVNKIFDLDIKVMPGFLIIVGFAYFCSLSMDIFRNSKNEVKAHGQTKAGERS